MREPTMIEAVGAIFAAILLYYAFHQMGII